jgi:hypothetical protein
MTTPFFNRSVLIIGLLLCLCLSLPVVSAFDLIFEDGSVAGPQKITLTAVGIGTSNVSYNTTSTITGLDPNNTYVVRISPMAGADYVRNPRAFLDELVPYLSDNFLVIVVVLFAIGVLAFGGRRR